MPVNTEKYNTSFRCFFDGDNNPHYTTHYAPQFAAKDIAKWIASYRFTHPGCTAISVKVWLVNGAGYDPAEDDED
jgi:hypothetical protein